jgi:hypothetical protein
MMRVARYIAGRFCAAMARRWYARFQVLVAGDDLPRTIAAFEGYRVWRDRAEKFSSLAVRP